MVQRSYFSWTQLGQCKRTTNLGHRAKVGLLGQIVSQNRVDLGPMRNGDFYRNVLCAFGAFHQSILHAIQAKVLGHSAILVACGRWLARPPPFPSPKEAADGPLMGALAEVGGWMRTTAEDRVVDGNGMKEGRKTEGERNKIAEFLRGAAAAVEALANGYDQMERVDRWPSASKISTGFP